MICCNNRLSSTPCHQVCASTCLKFSFVIYLLYTIPLIIQLKVYITHLSHLHTRRASYYSLFCFAVIYPALVYRNFASYTRILPMHRVGFEPTKLYAWHLKCHPFDHSGIDAEDNRKHKIYALFHWAIKSSTWAGFEPATTCLKCNDEVCCRLP